jgi:hypothetical protein
MTPSTSWKEAPAPDEDARFELYARRFVALQERNREGGKVGRALHHKGHGVLEGSLTIHGGLPEHARQGLFAKPATYEALVRFSNGAGKVQADQVADVRGIAIKVLGVDGDKVLSPGPTQDFLAILSSATPFRTADEFVGVVWATRSPPLALFRLLGALGLRAFPLVKKLVAGLKQPPASLTTKRFYSALPIQCGPYAARFSLTPTDETPATLGTGPGYLAEALADRLRRGPVVYDLALQFFESEETTPIEDASVDWTSPYLTVGKLTILQQDPTSARGMLLAERGERLSFDPWHALVAHRPLGGMMRARKHAYYASTKTREAAPEPASIAALLG